MKRMFNHIIHFCKNHPMYSGTFTLLTALLPMIEEITPFLQFIGVLCGAIIGIITVVLRIKDFVKWVIKTAKQEGENITNP